MVQRLSKLIGDAGQNPELLEIMQQILDAIDEALIIHDENRRIFLFNRAAEGITGIDRRQAIGRDCHQVLSPDGICGSHCSFVKGPIQGNEPEPYQVTFTNAKGEDRRLEVSLHKLRLSPRIPSGVIAVLRDITEVSQLRWQVQRRYSFHGMVGHSPAMQEVFQTIRQLSSSDYPVMISGESGTGKELVARAIHNASRRQAGPFVPINCGALPENILESELFGHVRGAFTGAIRDKKGRFVLAHKGTLFLDEVGELSPSFQVKLLRVLQEQRFEPVGGEQSISVDVRVISATNRDLRQMVTQGSFREDLFYRLAVVPIELPPLRERGEDLPALVEQILTRIRQETEKPLVALTNTAMDRLTSHTWPGNVRELINTLQYASVRTNNETIDSTDLPLQLRGNPTDQSRISRQTTRGRRPKLKAAAVQEALTQAGGNKVQAARILGVGRATLYRFLKNHPDI